MTDNNSLYSSPKAPDEFRTESPLRGFSEYTEFGGWLIAKGFKPSLQHLTRYLAGMESREGYRLVQVLEADTGVPTMIFRTTARAPLDQVADAFKPAELQRTGAVMSYVSAEFGGTGKTIEKELNRLLAKGFTDIREWRISAAHPDAPVEVVGNPGYNPDNWPYISDFETDDEGEPFRLIVKFKDKRATFFRGDRCKQKPDEDTITDWTPPSGCVHGFWQDGRFFIDFPAAVSMGHASAVAPPGYTFYGFKQDNPAVAFYVKIDEEVTSEPILPAIVQNPVDVLESMAEDIAEDLGLEVDRESFEVAREHLAEMVPAESVPDDVYFNLESGNFYQMTTNRGMGLAFHNKWWSRRAEFITKKLDGLFHLPEMVPLDLKVPGECKAEIVYDAGEAIPEHVYYVNGRFYNQSCDRDMGNEFRSKWIERRDEFPQTNDAHAAACDDPDCHVADVPGHSHDGEDRKFDDANPEHYNGWECGDLGERMTANGYQILKYCWRLGKKDDPCKELGKALRYLDRETDHLKATFPYNTVLPVMVDIEPKERLNYLLNRTANQSQFTADVARFLWDGYTLKDLPKLKAIIADHKAQLDCGHGLAI